MVVPLDERQVNDCNASAIASANRAGGWPSCPVHHHAAGEILSAGGSPRSSTEGGNGWLLPPAGTRCGEGPRLIWQARREPAVLPDAGKHALLEPAGLLANGRHHVLRYGDSARAVHGRTPVPLNWSTSSNTASSGFRDSRSCTSGDSCRAAATTASLLRLTPTPSAASSRQTLGSISPWRMKWRGGSGRKGFEPHGIRADARRRFIPLG